ncbi:uncharacterized protein [Procambarus clarkii]|uniref:uncharacterized protein n=1 Tax=Procambarus clarkii TaxID=6728 RepID=UPI001E670E31|nr:uncharacterized protein LOC123765792 isoform X2 [Procambarus clarkii]
MMEGGHIGMWMGAVIAVVVIVAMLVVSALAVKRLRTRHAQKHPYQGYRVVGTEPLYERTQQVAVPTQVGIGARGGTPTEVQESQAEKDDEVGMCGRTASTGSIGHSCLSLLTHAHADSLGRTRVGSLGSAHVDTLGRSRVGSLGSAHMDPLRRARVSSLGRARLASLAQASSPDGKLAVWNPVSRAKSAECLTEKETIELPTGMRQQPSPLSSTNSLDTLTGDQDTITDSRRYFTLKRGPFVEFTVQWASSTSCLSVYVVRLTSLPPKYHKSSCTLTLSLTSPHKEGGGNKIITKTSPRLRNANLNPECNYLFSYQDISLEQLRESMLVLGLLVRRSKHLLNKQVGELHYALGEAHLHPDTPRTVTEPITLKKKESSPWSSVSGGGGEGVWGQVQVMAQYQVTGTLQGRIKVVIIRAQSVLIGKGGGGEYKMQMVVKKGEETLAVHDTKPTSGPSPVWNTPFIFDVAQDKLSEHWIEMKLVRLGIMKKTIILGHTFLGLETTPTGSQHWQDIIDSMDQEITAWHPIILHN